VAEQAEAERIPSPGPKLQWFGLVDGELVALLEPAAARLSSLLPIGAMAGAFAANHQRVVPALAGHAFVAKTHVPLARPQHSQL